MARAGVTETDVADMRDGMDDLGRMVLKWSDAIGNIKSAKIWVPSDVKGFNSDTKEEIEGFLDEAAKSLRASAFTVSEILVKIAEVRAVVGAVQPYVNIEVPKIERPPENEKKTYNVLKKWSEEFHTPFSDGFDHYEERDYPEGAPNGHGRYQLWKNGHFESKSAPPVVDNVKITGGPSGVKADMSALLRRLEVLK